MQPKSLAPCGDSGKIPRLIATLASHYRTAQKGQNSMDFTTNLIVRVALRDAEAVLDMLQDNPPDGDRIAIASQHAVVQNLIKELHDEATMLERRGPDRIIALAFQLGIQTERLIDATNNAC